MSTLRVRFEAIAPSVRWAVAIVCLTAAVGLAVGSVWKPNAPPIENLLPRAQPDDPGIATTVATFGGSPLSDVTLSFASGAPSTVTAPSVLYVHAAGALAHPGLVTVNAGARVDDVVRAAGGLAIDAAPDSVNLAALVHDGERVVVPHRGVPAPTLAVQPADPAVVAAGSNPTAIGPIDLNTATVEQLDTLPGVGPATAGRIVEYRTKHGRFRSVTELLEVPGIGESKLTVLRPRVRV